MKILLAMLAAFVLLSCTSTPVRGPSSTSDRPKHYVITMHGLRGNAETYGEIHQFIKENIEKINSSYDVEVFNWTYPVGSAVEEKESGLTWNPHLIGMKFNREFIIGQKPLIPNLRPEDKISLIAYSMGGQMAMTWYYDSMFNYQWHPKMKMSPDDHQKVLQFMSQTENIIGLGSVFWGSLDSEFGWSILEKGDLSEIRRNYPKFKALCEMPGIQSILQETSVMKNIWNTVTGGDEELTIQQKNEKFLKGSVVAACDAVKFLGSNPLTANLQNINSTILGGLTSQIVSKGNVSPHELNHMRLTSDVTNEMRLGRINHLTNPTLKEKHKTKWTSIVGVFPCMGKKDKGLTCREFLSPEYKKVNDALVAAFSGVVRRETDGPVMGPSAVADFIFYTEPPGRETVSVPFDGFQNTRDLQAAVGTQNDEIFVENMHATVVPALESLGGALKSTGQSGAEAMKNFDSMLGVDVVIVNKECAVPGTCQHPNYKHILQILTGCTPGAAGCDHAFLNQYFKVTEEQKRLAQNDELKEELGSFAITLNIRLPKTVNLSNEVLADISKVFKFQTTNYGSGVWGENRVDPSYAPYAAQIARASEVLSSRATFQKFSDVHILRVFLVGRAWKKPGKSEEASKAFAQGVPVRFEIRLPGVKSRRVSAKVKPTYSTYIDMFMK